MKIFILMLGFVFFSCLGPVMEIWWEEPEPVLEPEPEPDAMVLNTVTVVESGYILFPEDSCIYNGDLLCVEIMADNDRFLSRILALAENDENILILIHGHVLPELCSNYEENEPEECQNFCIDRASAVVDQLLQIDNTLMHQILIAGFSYTRLGDDPESFELNPRVEVIIVRLN
ncbi:MAG: hypothetical protein FWG77_10060 [Treponema sp.]|nr:hypothetical protein [Treponema sp.]